MADGRSSPFPLIDGVAVAPEEKKKMIGKYEMGELLGEGTFSKVKKAVDSTNGNVVAIKIVNNALVQVLLVLAPRLLPPSHQPPPSLPLSRLYSTPSPRFSPSLPFILR